jgi:hypothetical protein
MFKRGEADVDGFIPENSNYISLARFDSPCRIVIDADGYGESSRRETDTGAHHR